MIVAGNALGDRIPLNLAADADGHVAQVAHGGGAVADFDIGNRLVARLDAVEEIRVVILDRKSVV